MEEAVVHTLPIAEELGMDDTTNEDKGKEKERRGWFSVHIRVLVVFELN
jgi:hypothetical protein